MPAYQTPVCDFDWVAPTFELPATDGNTYSLSDVAGENGLVLMFICNHCPFVLATIDRMVSDAKELMARGVGVAAICSNDSSYVPADGFPAMKVFAEKNGFPFPYLHDESQEVAKAYDAVCTPDFFGFNKDMGLQYRGRLDASGHMGRPTDQQRELFHAMIQVAETGNGPRDQIPSMGCSIKWKSGW